MIFVRLETTATLPDDQKSTPEIESSHESSDAWPSDAAPKRNFLGFSLTRTVFVTSYETEYTFTPIIVLNTVSMANDYALSCLPAGYTVCA